MRCIVRYGYYHASTKELANQMQNYKCNFLLLLLTNIAINYIKIRRAKIPTSAASYRVLRNFYCVPPCLYEAVLLSITGASPRDFRYAVKMPDTTAEELQMKSLHKCLKKLADHSDSVEFSKLYHSHCQPMSGLAQQILAGHK